MASSRAVYGENSVYINIILNSIRSYVYKVVYTYTACIVSIALILTWYRLGRWGQYCTAVGYYKSVGSFSYTV